jgi:hypothetical protein
MGKTLWGIDLDESPAGGLIERLLSEEELEALTDGGRAADDESEDPDDGDDDEDPDDGGFEFDVTNDDAGAEGRTDDGGDGETGESDVDVDIERDDDGGFDVDVETDDEDVEIDVDVDDGEVEVDVGARGASMVDAETPNPGDEGDSLRDRFPSIGDDTEGEDESGDEGDDDGAESGGIAAKIRPHLLKIAVAGVVLAVVAVLAWRYLGTVRSVAGDKLGRGSGDEEDESGDDLTEVDVDTGPGIDDDAPAARRRAKAAAGADDGFGAESDFGESVAADAETGADVSTGDEDDEAETGADVSTGDEDDEGGVARSGDSDMGALLGLAFLALVAALVRKFTEEREYDPLVDGPE